MASLMWTEEDGKIVCRNHHGEEVDMGSREDEECTGYLRPANEILLRRGDAPSKNFDCKDCGVRYGHVHEKHCPVIKKQDAAAAGTGRITATEVLTAPRYTVLRDILNDAFLYASIGKGEERHGKGGLSWENQRHAEISKEVGTGFPIGQAVKKAYESQGLDDAAAERELLGAVTYLASAIYAIRKGWRE